MPETQQQVSAAVGQQLRSGLAELGLVKDNLLEPLLQYLDMLLRWNKAYNLTAIRDPEAMVSRHLLDSLACAPLLRPGMQRLIDVGTGAGLPGIPLALLYPEREVHLLDSNGKKARFLFQVKTELGLANITIHNCRVESLRVEQGFDAVLSRAFASLRDMVLGCQQLCAAGGSFLAMKGQYPRQELAEVADLCTLVAAHRLQVPGLVEERHLIELAPMPGSTGENFD